ncbi:hypothetical protein B0H13DRAFT_2304030 [Mycena leptocephala]|nr:hypothetical protein B0H13DRAFT_2304030 [Mycena leptocephala]
MHPMEFRDPLSPASPRVHQEVCHKEKRCSPTGGLKHGRMHPMEFRDPLSPASPRVHCFDRTFFRRTASARIATFSYLRVAHFHAVSAPWTLLPNPLTAAVPSFTELLSVTSFIFQGKRHPYVRYSGALPECTSTVEVGALARISEIEWYMYNSAFSWVRVAENFCYPTNTEVRVGPDCRWVNRRTVTEHRAKRKRQENSSQDPEPKTRRHRTLRVRGASSVAAEPELFVLPENAFLLSLAKRWQEPSLSYYSMVSEKAVAVLHRLAHWPSALVHHPTFPVPDCEEFPTGSFVVEDLLAMDQDLIDCHDLCAQDSTPMDTVSAVLDMLFKSYLTQPWLAGQRIVSMSNIAATDKGILRCRLDWPAVVGRLGHKFAFGDYHWQYTPEELAKVFPPESPSTGKRSTKSNRERAQYLDRRGKEPWAASVRTPPGWFSDMHTDFAGLAQAIVHCDGEKLWLFWPATARNLDWWGLQHPQPWIGHPSRLVEALDALEGHAVIAFAGSSHTCVSFAHAAHWPLAREGLEFCKDLVRNPMYSASSAVELVEKVVHETPLWEQAMGRDSVAAAYLAGWKADTAPIYERHKNRNISSA